MKAIIFNGSNAEDVIKHTGASFRNMNGQLQVFIGAEWKTVTKGDVVTSTSWSVDIMTPAAAKEIGFEVVEAATEEVVVEEPVQEVTEPASEPAPEEPAI
jgi:hypothetical protein